ncbi:MAG: uracil-DNA glycosylase [Vampirovibrionales bacterium]
MIQQTFAFASAEASIAPPAWVNDLRHCHLCPDLCHQRQHIVVGALQPSPIVLIGEAPGQHEDEQGHPFVGRSGQLLTQLLAEAQIPRGSVVGIVNTVKCRPPNNRKPTQEELAQCRPWLKKQLALLQPRLLILCGSTAVEALLDNKQPISKQRGQWHSVVALAGVNDNLPLQAMPIFHPSYLLRNHRLSEGSPRWHTRNDLALVAEAYQRLCQDLQREKKHHG